MIERAAADYYDYDGRRPEAMAMTPAAARTLRDEVDGSLIKADEFMGIEIYTSVFCPPDQIYFGDKETIVNMIAKTEAMYRGRE